MRLAAVTVCVHESDSLVRTLANRAQFDRWLIVTAAGDRDTIALCRQHGLECHVSSVLAPNGIDVGPNRQRAIDEGRAALGEEGWVAALSSYVLLPRLARAAIDAATLEPGCRYGLGYRLCTNRRMADRLERCEPWRRRDSIQPAEGDPLFQLAASGAADGGRHRKLPITALLLTDGALDWGMYDSEPIVGGDTRDETLRALASGKRILVAGRYPGLDLRAWARDCARVYLADDFAIRGDTAAEAAWRAETAGLDNPVEFDTAVAVPDRSIDVLFVPGEATVERLLSRLQLWRRVLKDPAVICGDLYDRSDWPEASRAIAQLIGPPDTVRPSGFWQRTVDPSSLPVIQEPSSGPAAVIAHPQGGDPERVLVSLHALRQQWRGPVTVASAAPVGDDLVLDCARLGAAVQDSPSTAVASDCLTLQAGTLALQPVAGLIQATPTVRDRIATALRALDPRSHRHVPATIATAGGRPRPLRAARAAALQKGETPAFVSYGDANAANAAARDLWSRLAGEMRAAVTPPIRLAANSTVAVIVEPESLAELERNWPSWNFPPSVPVLALCVGVAQAEVRWIARKPQRIVDLAPDGAADPAHLLAMALQHVTTPRLILLPASAWAEPAAELFDAGYDDQPVVFHSRAEVRRVNGAVPLPWRTEPLLISLTADHARRLCGHAPAAKPPLAVAGPLPSASQQLKAWLHAAVVEAGGEWALRNVERWGWRLR